MADEPRARYAAMRIKSSIAKCLDVSRINAWQLARLSRHGMAILMYHRVLPPPSVDVHVQAGMYVHPDTLELHIKLLQEHFEIVPLSDIGQALSGTPRNPGRKPMCALTFDDGWRDFFTYAFPLLKQYSAPATVFLPTDYIGTDRWFWTDRLGFLLADLASREGTGNERSAVDSSILSALISLRGSQEVRRERAIALLKPYPIEEIERILADLVDVLGKNPASTDRAFLTWEEVQEMFESRLVAFGSHTAGHHILTTIPELQAISELESSMESLVGHKVVDPSFKPFCYPNGGCSPRLAEIVRQAGYDLAVTTQRGWVRPGDNPQLLSRIGIHQDMARTSSMFQSKLAGFV